MLTNKYLALSVMTVAISLLALGCGEEKKPAAPAKPATTTQKPAPTANVNYKDGVYEGVGQGYADKIKVKVTVNDHKITAIDVVSQNETPRAYGLAKDEILKRLLKGQNPVKVDSVTGASFTSNGFRYAVADALKDQLSEADRNTIKSEYEMNEPIRIKTKAANDERHKHKKENK